MSIFRKRQKRRKSWARRATGLFLVTWLNLALQPCVMAMELDNAHHCPHCPTEVSRDHHQSKAADCSYVDSYNYDSRHTQSESKDLPQDTPVIVDGMFDFCASKCPSNVSMCAERPADNSGGPPLNILYCVYLK